MVVGASVVDGAEDEENEFVSFKSSIEFHIGLIHEA